MDSLPIIAFVAISALYGFVWLNQTAHEPVLARRNTSFPFGKSEDDSKRYSIESKSGSDSHPNKSPLLNWDLLVIWIFVAVSFVVFFVASYVVWAKCHG